MHILIKSFNNEVGSHIPIAVNTFCYPLCFIVWILDNSLVFNFNDFDSRKVFAS